MVCNKTLSNSERGVALLDCLEATIEVRPSDFVRTVDILKSERFLQSLATELVDTYCEL